MNQSLLTVLDLKNELTKPQKIEFLSKTLRVEVARLYEFTDPFTQIKISKEVKFITHGDKEVTGKEWVQTTASTKPPPMKTIEAYYHLQTLKGHCIDNAETIHDKLRKLLRQIPDLKFEKTKYQDLDSTDFMGLRNIFSEFIKKFLPLRKIKEYDSNQKTKPYTSGLYKFILDRNIYTHGQLLVMMPENKFVIRYMEKTKIVFAEVNKETFLSFNEAYKELDSFISTVRKLINEEKRKGKDLNSK